MRAPEYSFSKTLVRLYGQTGLVNTHFTIRETVDAQPRTTVYVLADLWRKENGQWQLCARQLERLPLKPE